MPSGLGSNTTTIFFKGFHGDGLFEEFVTNGAVKAGQFVKLDTAGLVGPAAAGDNSALVIGVAFADAASGGNLTVAMRGYGTILAEGAASMNAGPVKYASFTSATGYNRMAAAVEASEGFIAATSGGAVTLAAGTRMDKAMVGWSLDASVSAGDVIRVVVKY